MKTFPTAEPLFPSLLLSREHAQRFAQLAHAVVHDTVTEYDDFVHRQQRKVNKRRWKRVKARENIAVYKERDHDPHANLHRGIASGLERADTAPTAIVRPDARVDDAHEALSTTNAQQQQQQLASSLSPSRTEAPPMRPRAASTGSTADVRHTAATPATTTTVADTLLDHFPAQEYNLPKLLMVGTLTGSLDDVLYGLSTHDSSSILLRSIYTQDEIVDGQVVHQFEGPTPRDPYRFLGIKWIIKGHPPAVSAVVAPRDVLFLNSVGTLERPSAGTTGAATDRLGYFLMHSIDLPHAVPSLYKSHGIVRARLSTCHVFRQVRPNCVEVYMKGYAEPSGKVVESLALSSAVSGLLFCWKSVVCAQAKKLVWLLQQEKQTLARTRSRSAAVQRNDNRSTSPREQQRASSSSLACALCERSLSVFKSAVECELCDRAVCSRCRVAMKLCFETAGVKLVEQRSVVLCKCCITRAHRMDTRQVATDEVRAGRFRGLTCADNGVAAADDGESYSAPTSIASDGSNSEPSSVVWDQSLRLGALAGSSTAKTTVTTHQMTASTNSRSTADVIDLLDRDEPVCEWSSSVESPTASSITGLESPLAATHSAPDRWMSPEAAALWTRMAALKMRQEDVYQFAKQNASLAEWSAGMTPVAPLLHMADLAPPYLEQQQRESID